MEISTGIIIKDKKVLLLKRSENEDEPDKWCPVNETIEDGETPEEAVVRGVKEELGADFSIKKFLFESVYDNKKTNVFLGSIRGTIKPDPEEVEETGWFSYDEAKKLDFAYGYEKVIERLHELKLI